MVPTFSKIFIFTIIFFSPKIKNNNLSILQTWTDVSKKTHGIFTRHVILRLFSNLRKNHKKIIFSQEEDQENYKRVKKNFWTICGQLLTKKKITVTIFFRTFRNYKNPIFAKKYENYKTCGKVCEERKTIKKSFSKNDFSPFFPISSKFSNIIFISINIISYISLNFCQRIIEFC